MSFADALERSRRKVHNRLYKEGKHSVVNPKYLDNDQATKLREIRDSNPSARSKEYVERQQQATPTPQTPSPQQVAKPDFDPQEYMKQMQGQMTSQINDIYNKQQEARLSQLRASRDKQVGQLNQERSQLAPQYANKRNQTDVVNQQNVQRLRELMASNGLTQSGENVTAQTGLANQRTDNINQLNLQEQQQRNDINRRVSDLYNPETENALVSALEAERAKALQQQMNADRGYGLNLAQFGLQQQGQQFNQGMAQDKFQYGQQRDQVADNRYQDQFDYRQQQDQLAQQQWQDKFVYQQVRDQIGDQKWQAQFEQDANQFGMQHALQRQIQQGNLSLSQARLAQQQAEFGWRQEQSQLDNQFRQDKFDYQKEQDAIQPQPGQPQQADMNDVVDMIDSSIYLGKDQYTNQPTVKDPVGLRSYIIEMDLDDSATKQLLIRYGLNPNPQNNSSAR